MWLIFEEIKMKAIFTFVFIVSFATVFAQPEEDKVKEPIRFLFDGMRNNDTAMIQSAFAPQAIMQTLHKNKEGRTEVLTEQIQEFITAIAKPHKEKYDEQITYDILRVDGDLAIAWTPYKFYIGTMFSHCGVDSFQLVKINGIWKIQYLVDTRRKEHCE